jgi:hypothetical protein
MVLANVILVDADIDRNRLAEVDGEVVFERVVVARGTVARPPW